MDQYAKIDHDILVRNLNAVCRELGQVCNRSGTGFFAYPPALNYGDIENAIPLALHNVAVSVGWIDPPLELEESDLDSGKADLLGGSLIVESAYKEWFLDLVADALIDLEAIADKNFNAQNEYDQIMFDFGPKLLSARLDGSSEKNGANPQRKRTMTTILPGS